MMFQPLSGLRVIDLSQVLAGPYATYQLALLGAEIIKIELPGSGDWTRAGQSLADLEEAHMGLSFLTQNANKKSVTLNLKHPEGLALAKKLISSADIFVENFKPGVAAKLGLSFAAVSALKPKIVYCSISAYGQDGPLSHRPAYDHIIQGMCGIMRMTGTPETEPNKVGSPYIDYATGLNAAFAIVAALHEAQKTAKAIHLDVAMLDTSMLLMASLMTQHLSAGWQPIASANEAFSRSPSSGAFASSDGLLMIAANNERQFRDLCSAIERPDILTDARWAEPHSRRQHVESLRQQIAACIEKKSAAEWEHIFDQAKVPAAKVRNLAEVLAEPQLKERAIAAPMPIPGSSEQAHLPTLGFKVDSEVIAARTAPPRLGADTEAVLSELGLDDNELGRLRADGVI